AGLSAHVLAVPFLLSFLSALHHTQLCKRLMATASQLAGVRC
uniref:Uncharacterized protein n=1 Tax=Aegilops tauschii subsp. strangulata TaxID=200361 RepID=A0A453M552_AEGTS